MSLSDEQLFLAYGKGDNHAFTLLYNKHKGSLYRFFLKQLNDKSKAQELYQETWVRAINAKETYRIDAKFTTWLYTIARNLLIDAIKKPTFHIVEDEESGSCHDNSATTFQQSAAIKQCVQKLSIEQRESFLLRYDSDFSPSEIAHIVDAKNETIKTRLRYALNNLRLCLTNKLGGIND